MIRGAVNARHEATIHLPVKDASGQDQQIETVIDTGFNGSLTLPARIIGRLGLPWRTRGSAILGNGSVDQFDIYAATVIWDGVPRDILVEEAATEPLIGMALLRGYDLRIQVIAGGVVAIEALT